MLFSQAAENLGMAMVYTLVTSAKEWLSERFAQDAGDDDDGEDEAAKDEVLLFSELNVFVNSASFQKLVPFMPYYFS